MWITWAPFLVTKWKELPTEAYVREAVLQHCDKSLAEPDPALAAARLDDGVCAAVAERLWIIVLSERQETLVVSREHRAVIQAQDVRRGIPR